MVDAYRAGWMLISMSWTLLSMDGSRKHVLDERAMPQEQRINCEMYCKEKSRAFSEGEGTIGQRQPCHLHGGLHKLNSAFRTLQPQLTGY